MAIAATNGVKPARTLGPVKNVRHEEVDKLLTAVKDLVLPFIRSADDGDRSSEAHGNGHTNGAKAAYKNGGYANGNGHVEYANGNGHVEYTNGNGHAGHTNGNGHTEYSNGNGHAEYTNGNGHAEYTNGNGHAEYTNGNGHDGHINGNGHTAHVNGNSKTKDEQRELAVKQDVQPLPYWSSGTGRQTALVERHSPRELAKLMNVRLPQEGMGHDGFIEQVQQVLQYSVNTWDSGFMSKLYASTDAPGLAADLVLSTLNTQVHTFEVSPALTMVEKQTARALAGLFGLRGPFAGGFTTSGGSTSNSTAMLIARHTLYPATKKHGNNVGGLQLAVFTSAMGHYSITKAALMLGLGSQSVFAVDVDPHTKRMEAVHLRRSIQEALKQGYTPFFVNATAGTTVFGSYDPLVDLAAVCKEFRMWLHVDGSLGGPAVFSELHKHKLAGSQLADSITINPHKMMGVPTSCSFLLGPDVRVFRDSNTLPANYLFHHVDEDGETYDLADLTLQCGRRGDALKLYLSWIYHGTEGYARQVDQTFETAAHLASLVDAHPDLVLVSQNPPPACQVCFYYARDGQLSTSAKENSRVTKELAQRLVPLGFMVDFAEGNDGLGAFLRPVVSRGTGTAKVEELVRAVVDIGSLLHRE